MVSLFADDSLPEDVFARLESFLAGVFLVGALLAASEGVPCDGLEPSGGNEVLEEEKRR